MAKCDECGYLAIRNEQGQGALEVSKQIRKTGRGKYKQESLFCYLASPAFAGAIAETTDCNKTTPWLEGRTPKEHEDMDLVNRIQLLNEQFQAKQMSIADKRHRSDIIWRWFTIIVASAAAAGTIWNAYTNYRRTPTAELETTSVQAISPPCP